MKNIVLASASPRRHSILKNLGVEFTAVESGVNEDFLNDDMSPAELAVHTAERKALTVARKHPENPVVGADTVVVLDGRVLGKPSDDAEAAAVLKSLSGREHKVITGLCLTVESKDIIEKDLSETSVTFKKLSDREINWYVSTGEVSDKAGAYGIQGRASLFVERIKGSYLNVVGFPADTFYRMLGRIYENPLDYFGI